MGVIAHVVRQACLGEVWAPGDDVNQLPSFRSVFAMRRRNKPVDDRVGIFSAA
jgi:hypothetical protein